MKNTPRIALFLMLLIPTSALASEGWNWTTEPTPGSANEIALDPESETDPTYENGDASDDIFLSEVMPDPEGSDTEAEWIELYNQGTTDVDLGNWSLDDEEGGSEPYIFPSGTRIEAQDFLVIYRVESDLALNNDADSVRLTDFDHQLKDEVRFEDAPEAQSYARIEFETTLTSTLNSPSWKNRFIPTARAKTTETELNALPWNWTQDVTQGAQNPVYVKIEGVIESLMPLKNMIILNNGNTSLTLSLETLNVDEKLRDIIFQPGNSLKGYGIETGPNHFELKRLDAYETTSTNLTQNGLKKGIALMLAFGAIGLFAQWQWKHRLKAPSIPTETT